jgi:threonine/homoserine/homoserine lactone efflux protein
MDPLLLLKGVAIGFALAIPIGPIGILCIRKTLAEGNSRGLLIGLGGATADGIFAGVASYGSTFISDIIAAQQTWIHLAGGVLLIYLGIRTYRVQHKGSVLPFDRAGAAGPYASALFLGFTNPITVLAYMAIFAAFGLSSGRTFITTSSLVAGVFLGSFLWSSILSFIATLMRGGLEAGGFVRVNKVAGVLIMVSGILAFATLVTP